MSNLKILLVDDEEELVSALVERLAYRGIDSKYALTGQEAIEMLEHERFDVVVLDLKLPGMSGVEVYDIIKTRHADLPVLLITGHGAPLEQLGSKPGEHYDLLEKPVSLEVLLGRIREVTDRRETS